MSEANDLLDLISATKKDLKAGLNPCTQTLAHLILYGLAANKRAEANEKKEAQ